MQLIKDLQRSPRSPARLRLTSADGAPIKQSAPVWGLIYNPPRLPFIKYPFGHFPSSCRRVPLYFPVRAFYSPRTTSGLSDSEETRCSLASSSRTGRGTRDRQGLVPVKIEAGLEGTCTQATRTTCRPRLDDSLNGLVSFPLRLHLPDQRVAGCRHIPCPSDRTPLRVPTDLARGPFDINLWTSFLPQVTRQILEHPANLVLLAVWATRGP